MPRTLASIQAIIQLSDSKLCFKPMVVVLELAMKHEISKVMILQMLPVALMVI